ncbi:DUF4347 domain-containing protein, partial [Methylobacterium sp. E-045]|uniref:DUF4347 domain-containing protein n=1 Tax=Methylobacterium sp. E-045 TaxID=2836575 RepID=UPI001FBB350B
MALASSGTLDPRLAPASDVVFIDARVSDLDTLWAGLVPGAVPYLLDPARDGLAQMAETLAATGAAGLRTISVVAHGAPGRLAIGPEGLGADDLPSRGESLAALAAALAPDGRLQLYACDLARGALGRRFLAVLAAELPGTGVSAASHPIGAVQHGGSWSLDTQVGPAAEPPPFTAAARMAYAGILTAAFGTPGDGIVTTRVGQSSDSGYSVTVQADGRILVAGYSYNDADQDFALVRYNGDGSLDTGFGGGDGIVTTRVGPSSDVGYSVTVQADGRILVAGYSHNGSNYDFALVRYNADGTLDTGFGGGDGIVTTPVGPSSDFGYSVTVQADGRILVAGYSYNGSTGDFALLRYNADGCIDTGFGGGDGIVTTPVGPFSYYGRSGTVQADGRSPGDRRSANESKSRCSSVAHYAHWS